MRRTDGILTNEIVVLSWLKFESTGLRCERPERYGYVHQFVWLIAVRYDPRIGISDSAHIVFFFRHLKHTKTDVKNDTTRASRPKRSLRRARMCAIVAPNKFGRTVGSQIPWSRDNDV